MSNLSPENTIVVVFTRRNHLRPGAGWTNYAREDNFKKPQMGRLQKVCPTAIERTMDG